MPAEWRDAGYLAAISIRYGASTPPGRFALPRIAVYWGESLGTFGSRMRETVARARKQRASMDSASRRAPCAGERQCVHDSRTAARGCSHTAG
jgi:hypothetical protein